METDYIVNTFPLFDGYYKILEEGRFFLEAIIHSGITSISLTKRNEENEERVDMLATWLLQGKVCAYDLGCPEAVDNVLRNMALEWNAGL